MDMCGQQSSSRIAQTVEYIYGGETANALSGANVDWTSVCKKTRVLVGRHEADVRATMKRKPVTSRRADTRARHSRRYQGDAVVTSVHDNQADTFEQQLCGLSWVTAQWALMRARQDDQETDLQSSKEAFAYHLSQEDIRGQQLSEQPQTSIKRTSVRTSQAKVCGLQSGEHP